MSDDDLLDNPWSETGARLAALSEPFDAATRRGHDRTAIGPGWRAHNPTGTIVA